MFFVALVLLTSVAVSMLRGGRLRRFAHAPLRHTSLLFGGMGLQVGADAGVVAGWFPTTGSLSYGLLLASQIVVLAWVLINWQLPGLPLVAIGLACNAAVMSVNGAMPVDPDAIRVLGGDPGELVRGKHVLMGPDTRLWWLADVWPVPPIRSIISLGDVVLAAGLIPITHHLMTYRTARQRRTSGITDHTGEPAAGAPTGSPDSGDVTASPSPTSQPPSSPSEPPSGVTAPPSPDGPTRE